MRCGRDEADCGLTRQMFFESNKAEAELEKKLETAVELLRPITQSLMVGATLPDDYEFKLDVTITAAEVRAIWQLTNELDQYLVKDKHDDEARGTDTE